MKALINFLYTGDYEVPDQKLFVPPSPATPSKQDSAFGAFTPISGTSRRRVNFKKSKLVEDGYTASPKADSSMPTAEFTFEVPPDRKHPLLSHLDVYEVADRIQQQDLKTLAERKFESIAGHTWMHSQFSEAIKKVYDIAPPGTQGDKIRNIILAVAAQHARDFFKADAFKKVLREVTDFAADLSAALCGHMSLTMAPASSADAEVFTCDICETNFIVRVPEYQSNLSCPVCTGTRTMREWRRGMGKAV